MKELNYNKMAEISAGKCDAVGCGLALVGLGLTFASVPTGLGAGLLLLGGASVGLIGMGMACQGCKQ